IASNEVAQHFRNHRKSRVVSLTEQHLDLLVEDMEQKTSNNQHRKALLKALNELKITDLQLIEMRFFEQRPFKEIAAILEITESNAKVKTYRILEKMKKSMLNNHGPGRAPIA
ncbi:MAG: sigma-70 family RNA polymerase sigma factor, partial [Bacteroidota bacterium]